MNNIITLEPLYKRDTKGKLRIWEVEYASTDVLGSDRHYKCWYSYYCGIS